VRSFGQDLVVAWRALWRAKPFATAAILTLGLGIAGVAVLLAFIQGVLLRPLPIRDQDRVIVAWKKFPAFSDSRLPFADDAIKAVGETSRLLEAVGGVSSHAVRPWPVIDADTSDYVNGALVTGSFFDVLGTRPVIGRALSAADDEPGSERVIVISEGLWRRRYGASPSMIGRRVTIDELTFTIAGVMPADSDYPRGVEAWRSTASVPLTGTFALGARQEVDLIARMRPGVSIEQATTELTALTRRYEEGLPPNRARGMTPVVRSFEDVMVGDTRPILIALFAAVGFVLLIACANVANLLLMRGEGRRSELALREALGAARRRIVQQLLAEGLVLTALATLVGLVAATWSLQTLIALMPDALPRTESIRVDGVVIALLFVITLPTAVLSAVAPAWVSARLDLLTQLRTNGRAATGSARQGRRVLVVAQVALAVAVTAAAGLVTQSLLRLQAVDTGVAAEGLWFVKLAMPASQYAGSARHAQFLSEATAALAALPQISSVTTVNAAPFSGGWSVPRFTIEGQNEELAAANPPLSLEAVRAGFFETMGVHIVSGRAFTDADRPGSLDVAIVSEEVAAWLRDSGDAVGRRIKMGVPNSSSRWLTVVGVAASTRYRDLAASQATLYLPAPQMLDVAQTLAIRTTAPPALVASLAREHIRAIDPNVHVMSVVPFARTLDAPLARPRFNAFLLNLFGVAALLLAGIGQYAVIAAYVGQREREIALRVALGASPANVRWLVLAEALRLAAMGAIIGLGGAAAISRLLRGLLYEVDSFDPITLTGAVLLLGAASVVAAWLPLRRAMRVDATAMLKA
jgi:putative ABC transport system permease protein